jgi:hypothetical protein
MRGIIAPAMVMVVAMAACYTGPAASHYVAILDELHFPRWDLAAVEVRGPGEAVACNPGFMVTNCPSASKRFLVEATAEDVYAEARSVVEAAGFVVEREFSPECDGRGGADCAFSAMRDTDRVRVHVYRRGEALGLDDGDRDITAVLVSAGQ